MRICGVVASLVGLVAFVFLALVRPALAQEDTPGKASANSGIEGEAVLADLATVVAYREAMLQAKEHRTDARRLVSAKEEFLAQALGKVGVEYSEQGVRGAHAELVDAQQKFEAIELESF